jgi:hypothetical protein
MDTAQTVLLTVLSSAMILTLFISLLAFCFWMAKRMLLKVGRILIRLEK